MITQSFVKLPKGIKDDFRILGNQQKHTKTWKHVLLLCFCNNQNVKNMLRKVNKQQKKSALQFVDHRLFSFNFGLISSLLTPVVQ
jgi:hypothetical protein